jgi:nucleotide-binding universal stress UspA family protein
MRVLLGADMGEGVDAPVVRLLKRLRFNAAQVEPVRVVAPPNMPVWDAGAGFPPIALAELTAAEEKRARELVCSIAESFGDEATPPTVLRGMPTQQLLTHADKTGADLIAIDGHEDSPVLAFLIGSVARGLVLGARQSVLLAKASTAPADQPVRAVLATDHSEYADICWERLMRFWPRGISHLTILTSYPEDRLKALEPMLPPMGISATQAMHDQLAARNDALATRLSDCFHPACTTITSVVSSLPVHEAITEQMKADSADLLILGAQGHGFLERLALGSVALREALTLPQSVLVVRV